MSSETRFSLPRAQRQMLAVVDRNPLPTLVTALAVRDAAAPATLGVTLVVREPRPHMCRRVKAELEHRGVEVAIHEVPGCDEDGFAGLLDTALAAVGQADEDGHPLLDVSSACPGHAVAVADAARGAWKDAGDVVAYDGLRNRVRFLSHRAPGQAAGDLAFDLGRQGGLAPESFLGLFGLRAEVQDPYGAALGREADAGLLREASTAVLRVFREDPNGYEQFRNTLQQLRSQPDDLACVIPLDAFPGRMMAGVRALDQLGLLRVDLSRHPGHAILPDGASDGAGFLLAGGWLEVLVADCLARALPDRRVARNVHIVWGAGNPFKRPSTETDVLCMVHNRLHVLSCKNDRSDDNLRDEVERLRARTAEFGERWVRPTLLSTESLRPALVERCQAYEIGCVAGRALLDLLEDDLNGSRPHALMAAVLAADPGGPEPGVVAG
jgi:hypothetical protein